MIPITFFGSDSFSAAILSCILRIQHEKTFSISAIVTQPARPQGRGMKVIPSPVARLAEQHQIPLVLCENRRELDMYFESNPETPHEAGVLASFGILISQHVIDRFPLGIINVHPSLLPRWRGASPIQSSILHGDEYTGVSLMKLVREMDAGPVFAQTSTPISSSISLETLQRHLEVISCDLLSLHLGSILNGTLSPSPQDESQVTTCSKITKSDGALNPYSQSALEIDRRVRALWPWPKTWITWTSPIGETIALRIESGYAVSPHVGEPGSIFREENGEISIGTIEGRFIIQRIGRPGRPTQDAVSFARGFPFFQGKISPPSYDKT